ncbi:putative WHTH_GntR-like protein [Erwinia phage PEp14]|uniref:Putative WHTH_GntR-like protein n=1 Tax=Erwinia phage PEp14 TaxID=1131315 RepID=H2DE74_9CAUD|nr:transcriptional regulator [Erwinia phage PEp14]AEY69633.1 putative WHTH_GntR-like protein [Erwinia phage PEp14]
MELKSPNEINGSAIRAFRMARNERLEDFWGAVGYSTSRGSRYETGDTLPEHVRRLVYLHYVVGIPTNMQGAEFQNLVQTIEQGSARKVEEAREIVEQLQALTAKSLSVLKGAPSVQVSEDDQLLADARGWIAGSGEGTTIAKLAKHFGITKPQARRICNQLVEEGLLEKPAHRSEYYPEA